MAATITLDVQPRSADKNQGTGSRVSRKLREKGRVPAIVYGHKQDNLPISLTRDDVWKIMKQKAHLAELRVAGQTTETVLVKDIQWDHLGREIIHMDFARVDFNEEVETLVKIEAKGTAVGMAAGGILGYLTHEIKIQCKAIAIPEVIRIDIANLQIGQGVHGRDVVLPAGVVYAGDPDLLILHIVAKSIVADVPGADVNKPTTPEVIKKEVKAKDDAAAPAKGGKGAAPAAGAKGAPAAPPAGGKGKK